MAAAAPVRERREALLGDPRVKRWYKDHRTASTAEVQLAQFELFLRRMKVSVDGLLELARAQRGRRSKKFEDLVHAWIEREREEGRPDSYLATNWYSVRSFLRHEESAPEWTPKLKVRFGTTIVNEVVPTPEQLRTVLDRAPVPRVRSLILMLATSGMRIGTLGARFAINGLRLRDLPDLDTRKLEFRRVPFRIDVPAELSKAGNAYFTFASEETAKEYTEYLTRRRERGEKLGPNSPVFAPEPKASNVHLRVAPDGAAFLSEKGLADEIRTALARVTPPGVRWRPYVLRAFASSELMRAEGAGLITRDAREFLLGHSADIGRRYNLSKGRVRGDLEEEVRAMYSVAADKFLRILTVSTAAVDYRPVLRVLLAGSGYDKAEIDREGELTEERVIEMIRAKRGSSAEVPEPKPGDKARTVLLSELDSFLSKGWKPIAPAGLERFVVGAPN